MLDGMAREPNQFDELFVPFEVRRQPLPADIGLSPPRFFPPPTATTAEGLLCVGGRLSPEWLLDAYRHGIFPWPMWDDDPIAWWSPDPRAIIELDGFHVSRRLQRTMRSGKFQVTCDRDFARRDPRLRNGRRSDRQHLADAQHDRGVLPDARIGTCAQRGGLVRTPSPSGRGPG